MGSLVLAPQKLERSRASLAPGCGGTEPAVWHPCHRMSAKGGVAGGARPLLLTHLQRGCLLSECQPQSP